AWMYRQYKSLVFLTESAEHNELAYPPKMRSAAGVHRLRALLELGNRRDPRLYYRGYPCQCVVGMFHAGAVAIGKTAAERRTSRIALWQQRAAFETLAAALPERPQSRTLQVKYTGPTLV